MDDSRCVVCEAPDRVLWPASRGPALDFVEAGNWISLHRCASCRRLWVIVAHEPYSVFRYAVWWKWMEDDWSAVGVLDRGAILHRWHHSVICQVGPTLTGADRDVIERHRARSSGLAPYGNQRLSIGEDPDRLIETVLGIQ